MTRQELQTYLDSQVGRSVSNQEVDQWIQAHPDFKVDAPAAPSIGGGVLSKGLPFVVRLAPAALTAEGGIPGALGAGAGEVGAQLLESFLEDKPFRPSEIASAAAIGAIPAGGPGSVLKQAAKGAGLGAASNIIESVVGKGEAPSAGGVAGSALAGGLFGAAAEGILNKILNRAGEPAVEKAAEPLTSEAANVLPGLEKTPTAIKFTQRSAIPAAGTIPAERKFDFPSIGKLPEPVQADVQDLLEKHNGFADQRRNVQSWARTNALAERTLVNLAPPTPGKAFNAAELSAYRDALTSISMDKQELTGMLAGAQSPEEKGLIQLKLDKTVKEQVALLATYRGAKAEAGRALNILKQDARVLETGDAGFIEKMMSLPSFEGRMDEAAKKIALAGNDPMKQFQALKDEMESNQGWFRKATSAYYNSLLSGTRPSIHKAIGDTFTNLTNVAITPVSAITSKAKSMLTGKPQEVFAGELGKEMVGTWTALPKAMQAFQFVLKHGFSLHDVEELNFGAVHGELPGGMVTNLPSRMLKAVTDFYYTLGLNQELYANAFARAKKEGLTDPGQIQKYMVALISGSSDESKELFAQAQNFAKRAVYLEKKGPILDFISKLKNDENQPLPLRAAATFLFPFVNIPGKILQRGLETSPAGFFMKGVTKGVGREQSQAIGRATAGTLALAPIAWMAINGKLSGDGPKDPGQRQAMVEQGWIPHAVKIGDRWVNFQYFQPISEALDLVANAWEAFREGDASDKSASDIAGSIVGKTVSSIVDVSWFQTLNQLLQASQDPGRFGQGVVRGVAQGMVPASGLLREGAAALDPTYRNPSTVGEDIKAIIPGLSSSVPARLTRFGQPEQRPTSNLPLLPEWLERGFLAPTMSQEKPNTPVAQLLQDEGISLRRPKANLRVKGQPVKLTKDQEQVIEEALGQEREAALSSIATHDKEPSPKTVRDLIGAATREVDQRAISLIRRNQPLTLEKLAPRASRKRLKKSEVDAAYQRYLEQNNE